MVCFCFCSSGDRRRRGGGFVRRLPGDAASLPDEEEGRGQLHSGGTQAGHRHLPETRQAGGVLRVTLVHQGDASHSGGETSRRREEDTLCSPLLLFLLLLFLLFFFVAPPPPHLLASCLQNTWERLPLSLGTFFSMKMRKKEKKRGKKKKKIQIYSAKITHTHKMFLKVSVVNILQILLFCM